MFVIKSGRHQGASLKEPDMYSGVRLQHSEFAGKSGHPKYLQQHFQTASSVDTSSYGQQVVADIARDDIPL